MPKTTSKPGVTENVAPVEETSAAINSDTPVVTGKFIEANSIQGDTRIDAAPPDYVPNFPPLADPQYKREVFLWGMVAADVWGFRNVLRDTTAITIQNQIKEETGRDDGDFIYYYAENIAYVQQLHFAWIDGAPQEYINLEQWWDMVTSGKGVSECYLWYIEHVPNLVHNLFRDAVNRSHKIWKPIFERANATEAEVKANPNS